MTTPVPLSCPRCRAHLEHELAAPGTPRPCPSCERPLEGLIFSAYDRPPIAGKSAEAVVAAEDAGCFYHPQSRAQEACDICGRFLCALCDVELLGRHVCPGCVSSARRKKHDLNLDGDRMLYGGVALMIAALPVLLFWPVTLITGPLAVFVALYGWNKPQSLTGAGRSRYVTAIVLGFAETAAWGVFLASLFKVF